MKCLYCFNETEENTKCSVCGFDGQRYLPAENHLAPGTVIGGRYELGCVIGEGGFGITYSAFDSVLKNRCAIKEFFPRQFSFRNRTDKSRTDVKSTLNGEDEYRKELEKFKKEASRLAVFDGSRNIINVKDYISENNTGYIVMNFAEGMSLKEYLVKNGGRLPYEDVFEMMAPLIKTLGDVHHAGILHRDISTDNIIVEKSGRLVLIDFGSAREYDSDKSLSVMLTYGFAPPEQYSSKGVQGPWTDIYSLCAVMYTMLTGSVPPEAMDRLENRKLESISAFGVKIPNGKEKAILKGMSLDYESRWQNASELYGALYESSDFYINYKAVIIAVTAVLAVVGIAFAFSGKEDEIVADEVQSVVTTSVVTDLKYAVKTETVTAKEEITDISGTFPGGSWNLTPDGVLEVNGTGTLEFDTVPWIKHRSDIRSVIISEGITGIGDKCFRRASNIETVKLPDSLVTIGNEAFYNTDLISVEIPDSVEQIGENAFGLCRKLVSVKLPSGIEKIAPYTFSGCISLAEIKLPDSIKNIGEDSFRSSGLEKLVLPENEIYLAEGAFADCDDLEEVTFPKGYEAVEYGDEELTEYIFSGRSLSNICFEEGISKKSMAIVATIIENTSEDEIYVHLPNDIDYTNVYMNYFPDNTTFIGTLDEPRFRQASEHMQSVKATDGTDPDVYINGNILYVNTENYFPLRSVYLRKKTADSDSDYVCNIKDYEFNNNKEAYTEILADYFLELYGNPYCKADVYMHTDLNNEYVIDITLYKETTLSTRYNYFYYGFYGPTRENVKSYRVYMDQRSDDLKGIKLMVIGENVKNISKAFPSGLSSLRSIYIPDSVSYICDDAFVNIGYRKIYTNSEDNTYLREYADRHHNVFNVVDGVEDIDL